MRKMVHTTFGRTKPGDSLGRDGWGTITRVETAGGTTRYHYDQSTATLVNSNWHLSDLPITVYREDTRPPAPRPLARFVVLGTTGGTQYVEATSMGEALNKTYIQSDRILSITRVQ